MSYSYAYSPDVWPALITLALTIYLGTYCWRRRDIPAAKPFGAACLLGGIWTLGTILEISALDFATKVFWEKFQAIWHLPVAATMTCFVLQYAGLGRWLTRRNYILLFLFPLLSVPMMVTNDYHHLIWAGFRMGGHVLPSPGKLFWVFFSYIYLLGIVNFVVLVRLAIHSPGHRLPVAIIVSGQIIARIGYALDKLEAIGPGEAALLTLGLMAVVYAVALIRFHAIDPVAAARKAVLQQMQQGMVVLDLEGRIVDVNPMAAGILGKPENELRNTPLEKVMPIIGRDLVKSENKGTGQTDIFLGEGNSARQYTLNQTRLKGRQGEIIGQLILLQDVTEQRRSQRRILEQQSVVATLRERERLARELHDGIGQTLGYVNTQTQTALKWILSGNHTKAESLMRRLAEVAQEAHADVRGSILGLQNSPDQEWSFIHALKNYIDRFQTNYGIETELSISAGIGENTFDPGAAIQVLRVIQEAFTNAHKHSGAHTLSVFVGRNGNTAQITVRDDGRGFDALRREGRDGGHFGLVFMQERMQQIGGSLTIDSAPRGGTLLKLDVPIEKSRGGLQ